MKMETLQELMKKVLADTFAFYLKAHNYHWNVEGVYFSQFHDFFGKLYEEIHDVIDPIAEELRTLDTYAPGSMTRFLELTEIKCELTIPSAIEMVKKLQSDNDIILKTLLVTFEMASNLDQQGLADFIAGRIDHHKKIEWQLRSITR